MLFWSDSFFWHFWGPLSISVGAALERWKVPLWVALYCWLTFCYWGTEAQELLVLGLLMQLGRGQGNVGCYWCWPCRWSGLLVPWFRAEVGGSHQDSLRLPLSQVFCFVLFLLVRAGYKCFLIYAFWGSELQACHGWPLRTPREPWLLKSLVSSLSPFQGLEFFFFLLISLSVL